MDIIINLNKPKNITSHDAVQIVKRHLSCKKAGHAGTLDPLAEGVLIVCIDGATKIARFISEFKKEYIFTMKLGERTDTFDMTGKVIQKVSDVCVEEGRLKDILKKYVGTIEQTPPMYSAIKVKGVPLYKLARRGIEIERPKKRVNIYDIELLRFNVPFVELRVVCSKGTYVRSLCDDIGNELGVYGHMYSLIRTRVGDFKIEDSVTLEDIKKNNFRYYKIEEFINNFKPIS